MYLSAAMREFSLFSLTIRFLYIIDMRSELYEWRPVVGYEGLYEVNNLGEVRSLDRTDIRTNSIRPLKGKILKPIQIGDYLTVHLSKNGIKRHCRIHCLVAKAFLPNPDNLPQVNHKDEDKTNNRASNLEWCTSEYNVNYGTGIERRVAMHRNNKLSGKVYQYTLDGEFIREWPSVKEISRTTGYSYGYLIQVLSGKHKTAYGYKWLRKIS